MNEAIIQRCVQGERKAQYEVYQLYSKAMFNICVRMLNSIEEAEDVLQDAFLSAFKNIKSFKGDATFGAWLKRIVINKCLNYLKKNKIEALRIDDVHVEPIDESSAIDENELQLEIGKVKKAITQLPDGFRIVFSLYLLEGYDHKEIAEILQITESTSKSQYNRAKKKLRMLLQDNR